MAATVKNKVVLIVIDGWGLKDSDYFNAIQAAETPTMDWFKENVGWIPLDASGLAVGLPEGVMGNSEVGHLTIGAGQAQFQDLVRINLTIKKGLLGEQPALKEAFARAVAGNGRLHFLGLVSPGGVHSHQDQLYELLKEAKKAGVPKTFVQAFLDGRDTPPDSGVGFIEQLEAVLKEIKYGSIGTIVGRYYAMDRDKRWDRVKLAYEALIRGEGEGFEKPQLASEALKAKYAAGEKDEFVKPVIIDPSGGIQDGDTLVCFNFRSDRMREIAEAIGISPPPFETEKHPKDLSVTTYTQYKSDFPFPVIFPPQVLKNVLCEWLSKKGLTQFHTAETEKYAHVTFFFNGGRELQFDGEERQLVQSPKVATYDLEPKMAAAGVGDAVIAAIETGKYDFIMNNFAPPDMVGHTGMYEPAIIGVHETDRVIGLIWEACKKNGYTLFITADHGNAEVMKTPEGDPVTSHTTNPVPLVFAAPGDVQPKFSKPEGTLADVAPTILSWMGLEIPSEMTGHDLL